MIKAIETIYNGYRFRSRLEARWAVFFDAIGLKYEYEPEGYDLGNGMYYLPDFLLPKVRISTGLKNYMCPVFVEIKADIDIVSNQELIKVETLARKSGTIAWVIFGLPRADMISALVNYFQKKAQICQAYFIEEPAYVIPMACLIATEKYRQGRERASSTPAMEKAYNAAKGARFEHGERP